ncbi:MAG: DUF4388 domain-containing protein [Deltaproteobacteria bacterium]|nr:DUF4388 domain-containing protein [Deltaproteobacteria bacterium]
MALKGTIRDFGVADIFQLIGHQGKTGVLVLDNDVDEVRVYFKDGSVVRAENVSRPAQMLLGNFMVRAGMLTQSQIDLAVREQRRSLKRIGAVLIDLGYASAGEIAEFATLQMTETIYPLFEWSRGTYQFETVPVEPSPEGVQPLRADTIVMNGIRMMDEWAGIREKVPSFSLFVEPARGLSAATGRDGSVRGRGHDDASAEALEDIGPAEREVYELARPERTVREVIDLSRLGEFEACRAITVLLSAGFVRLVEPVDDALSSDTSRVGFVDRLKAGLSAASRIVVSAGLVFALASLIHDLILDSPEANAQSPRLYHDPTAYHLAASQVRVIRRALEVYRLEAGVYPDALTELVSANILSERDIRYPFSTPYFYRAKGEAPVVLPPLF